MDPDVGHGAEPPERLRVQIGVRGEVPAGEEALADVAHLPLYLALRLGGANGQGPILSTTDLAALRAKSGPRYRAYIAAHSLIWHPGVTRRRHLKGRGWGWSRDLADCPVLAAENRDRLAYATAGERRKRSRAAKDAVWEKLPGIRILDRAADTPDGRRGLRIAPDKHGPPDLIAAATNDRDVRHYLGDG